MRGALMLIKHGFKVFPIKPGHNAPPLISNWQCDATSSPQQVAEWWGQWPEANIGILTTGWMVIEVSPIDVLGPVGGVIGTKPNDWIGMASLEAERCPIVETPTGGRMYFFKAGRESVPVDETKSNATRKSKRSNWTKAALTLDGLQSAVERARKQLAKNPDFVADLERLGRERELI